VHFHPDLNVDLAVLPVAELLDHWASQGRTIFYKALTPSLVPDEKGWADFDALEDLLMIGCPNGLFDQENHFAIIRKGITASPLSVPYEGKQEFLADIACFGGSSGSPIFSYNPGISFDRNTSQYSLTGRGLRFVGVLYAGPVYLQEEQVVLRTPVVNISTPMHLGFAIRSSEVKRMVHDLLIARGSTPAVQAV
ncbi:MAG TPA: hypothetical protein VGR19_10105, partial [Allosphingosinicella sp.]|nr:hypothetical protein [Allosphingosinicella sp.]